MNALLIALTMSLTGAEGTFEAPGRLSADLAPFPLRMSLCGGEAAAVTPVVDLRSPGSLTLCVAFELPSYAVLLDVNPVAAPLAFDGTLNHPWNAAQPAQADESMAWLKNGEQR
jgi:hypothetical protein